MPPPFVFVLGLEGRSEQVITYWRTVLREQGESEGISKAFKKARGHDSLDNGDVE